MSSGDEDSKDQQVCQTSTWLHFSLQTGGTTTHYSHDKGDTKKPTSFHARQCGSTGRFFNKIKQCRRVATRYDKLAVNYLAFIQLASIRLWLRVYESTP